MKPNDPDRTNPTLVLGRLIEFVLSFERNMAAPRHPVLGRWRFRRMPSDSVVVSSIKVWLSNHDPAILLHGSRRAPSGVNGVHEASISA